MSHLPSSRLLLSFILCASLTGCSAILKPVRRASHLSGEVNVNVNVDAHANQDMPIAVDILAIADSKTVKDISALTAQAWFQKRSNYVRLHPSELHVYSWEWVPGQEVAAVKIPQSALADAIILFANYSSAGEHSATLPRSGTVRVELGPKDFQVIPGR